MITLYATNLGSHILQSTLYYCTGKHHARHPMPLHIHSPIIHHYQKSYAKFWRNELLCSNFKAFQVKREVAQEIPKPNGIICLLVQL